MGQDADAEILGARQHYSGGWRCERISGQTSRGGETPYTKIEFIMPERLTLLVQEMLAAPLRRTVAKIDKGSVLTGVQCRHRPGLVKDRRPSARNAGSAVTRVDERLDLTR
jgi:hypothetical protein